MDDTEKLARAEALLEPYKDELYELWKNGHEDFYTMYRRAVRDVAQGRSVRNVIYDARGQSPT